MKAIKVGVSGALCLAFACVGHADAAAQVRTFSVDSAQTGALLPNPSQMISAWAPPKRIDPEKLANLEWDVRDFTQWVEVMGATGGNADRDCFRNPNDRSVKDDYDFTKLVDGCRSIIAQRMKPYLKLGNVPMKLSSNIGNGEFMMNIRPPDDYEEYARYMEACAKALVSAFGKDELKTWRYAVLTEYENGGWFLDATGNAERTFHAYCLLYETTVEVFSRVISPDLTFGAHAMAVTEGSWDERRFFSFVAVRKLPLKFVTASFYDDRPGKFTHGFDLPKTFAHLRDGAEKAGLKNLFYGVDEGRLLYGAKGGSQSQNLATRIVGDTFQAGYDARIVRQLFDSGADYFAAWGYMSGPNNLYEGIPSVSFHVAKEAAKFKGMRRLQVAANGGVLPGIECEAVAAIDESAKRMQVMAYSFTNTLHATGTLRMRFDVKLPEAWRGKSVTVRRRLVDDSVNWFPMWRKDRAALGIGDNLFNWSPDDPAVMSGVGLADPKHRAHFQNVLLPRYREMARLKPKSRTFIAEEGKNFVHDCMAQVNSAVFLEFVLASE